MQAGECKASWAVALAVVAMGVAPQAAAAAPVDVLRDCADDSALSREYSRAELQGALRQMPGDLDEYSNCRAVIGAALAAAGSGPAPEGGGAGEASGGEAATGGEADPVAGVASHNGSRRGGSSRREANGSAGKGGGRGSGAESGGPASAAERTERQLAELAEPAGGGGGGGASDIPGVTTFLSAARTVGEAPPLLLLLAAVGCLAILGAVAERRRA